LARRATAIKQERTNNKGIVLVLDAGNTLAGQWLAQETQGRVMIEAMNAMAYDAMTLGQVDFQLGLEQLKQRAAEAKFPFLAANLVNTADRLPLFKATTIIERQGAKIGLIGLSEPEAVQVPGVREKATALNTVETARRYVGELRPQVDLLVVLSHLGIDQDKALAQQVPGIDIIIGGNTRQLMDKPDRVGNTLIVQQGYRGEWMGRLQASFGADGVVKAAEEQIISLEGGFADDKEVANIVNTWGVKHPSPTPLPSPTPRPTTVRQPVVGTPLPPVVPAPTKKP
jgi:5'-nucleotidase